MDIFFNIGLAILTFAIISLMLFIFFWMVIPKEKISNFFGKACGVASCLLVLYALSFLWLLRWIH